MLGGNARVKKIWRRTELNNDDNQSAVERAMGA